jgi:competence protein ComEC
MEEHREQTQGVNVQSKGAALPTAAPDATPTTANIRPFIQSIWQAPLVPVAVAVTAGIVLDRKIEVPLFFSLPASLVLLAVWFWNRHKSRVQFPLLYLAFACGAAAAAYHHWHREIYAANDIGEFAGRDPKPVVVRGLVEEEPLFHRQPEGDPLKSFTTVDSTTAVLRVNSLRQENDWLAVSGRARLIVSDRLQNVHVGDEIEVVGRLVAPSPPANPGEFDFQSYLKDRRIRAEVQVRKTAAGVVRLNRGWSSSFWGWLALVRGWGERVLLERLPPETSGVASALLLGESSTMTFEDWDKYIRTGVIHVLAISGQHLMILAFFLWWTLRLAGVRRRRGAWLVGALLLAYALLTGFRPPIVRAAVVVLVAAFGVILRRPVMTANSFALAWLVVAALNPTDLFDTGCQLSFLSVAILYWGIGPWLRKKRDPLEQLVDESRSWLERILRRIGAEIGLSYVITSVITVALFPLVAARYHLISLAGLVIAPPTIFLGAIALVAGFLLLPASLLWNPLAALLAWITHWSIAGCEYLVNKADGFPGSHWYVGDVSEWWLWGFYGGLLAVLAIRALQVRWRLVASAGLGWVCCGLVVQTFHTAPDEFRCTFLAVGHGGCTVLETPDGRVLLYDAGSMNGPEVTRRQIAPFLWNRGIRRIDEIFLSHADMDHFNGLPALLERFPVGQVTCTPSFSEKEAPGVQYTLSALERFRIPVRTVRAGDQLSAGPVDIEVLHPPQVGPEGNENARSMVLLVRHLGHTLLLTGDLEGPGLERVLDMQPPKIDILMAPHHGSRVSNTPVLAAWARPRAVISCEGLPRGLLRAPEPYTQANARFLGTWPHGAVTVRSHATGMVVETYVSKERFVLR